MQSEGRCYVHNFELAEIRCRNCGYEFCSECLVYAFGANKPPYCVACALAAAGVRSTAARQPQMSRREIKRIEKERKKAEKDKLTKTGPRVESEVVDPSPVIIEATGPEEHWPTPSAPPEDDPFAWADDPDSGQRVPY